MWPFPKKKPPRREVRIVRGSYDAAQTTNDNTNHWAKADLLSVNATASPAIRQSLRSRARYEVANNSYAKGIVLTLANDTIGTGPRLQMSQGERVEKAIAKKVEAEFRQWAIAVDLPGKLRTMRAAKAVDGEAFCQFIANQEMATPVKLGLQLLEADQVSSGSNAPATAPGGIEPIDGLVFDTYGNVRFYEVLDYHPGALNVTYSVQPRRVRAENMIHWFRVDRPGQSRGLPEILPALPLFAELRRYTLAVVAAAESAADWAIVMRTSSGASTSTAEVDATLTMDVERRMAVFAPEGWEPTQIKAEQPTTTYDMFKRELLNEIARCLNMPYNIAACDSSSYNYASGRLDHQTYGKAIRVEQAHLESVVLDRILAAWMAEAVLVYPELDGLESFPHTWFWDGQEHVDPVKDATAQQTRLEMHTTTLAAEYAKQGRDWETELRQRAKELKLQKELGLLEDLRPESLGDSNKTAQPPAPPKEDEEDDPPLRPYGRKRNGT